MEEKKKKVVVAFSGGLDTSFTVMYLAKEKGYEVYAACANTGGFSEEQLKQNEENAYKLGAVKYVTLDVTREYYEKSLKYMVFGNVLRNGTYPISVSSERIFQGLAIARYANEIGADAIAHGSTGASNDQIRFDMTFLVLAPGVELITLPRDMALSRQLEIDCVIVPDFPYEEKNELLSNCRKYDVDLISLIAPTSDDRIEMIAREAMGYIYVVSSLGVTGIRSNITTDIGAIVKRIREVTDTPVAVGFGIATPEQAEKMAWLSDGAIVGSAIVKIVVQYGKDAAGPVKKYVEEMVAAVRKA